MGHDLLGCAVTEHPTFADHVAAVGDLERFAHLVVGDQDGDPLVAQPPDDLLDAGDCDRVDARERLVQQDDLGIGDQGAGDFQAPAFAAGERLGQGFAQPRDVELFEQFVTATAAALPIEPQQFHDGQQILFDRQLAEHAGFLGQIAHSAVACPAIHGPVGHLHSAEHHPAGVRFDHAARHAKTGGLACAVGTEQADDLTGLDSKVHAIDHPSPAVGFHQSVDIQHRPAPWSVPCENGLCPAKDDTAGAVCGPAAGS